MKKLMSMAILSSMLFCSSIYATASPDWYSNFIFKDPNFTFELIRVLGQSSYGGADIGEVLQTGKVITSGDMDSWYTQWLKTADRVYQIAENAHKKGHTVSARAAYLRAASYYRSAGFYMDAKDKRAKSVDTWKKSRASFLKAIASLSYIKLVKIPYEKTFLEGYLIRSCKPNAPILIVHTGFDGTMEELYFDVAVAAHARGLNVLLFEGPGQGGALRARHLYFRPDWEHVVTPVVDYIETLPNINKQKIALMGISMGGYLAPRACAFEHRIAACIANEGAYDFYSSVYQAFPPELLKLLSSEPEAFNAALYQAMQKSLFVDWFFHHGMWAMHAESPAEFAQAIRQYTLEGVIKNIKCPTLILDRVANDALKSDAKKVYDQLQCPKKYYVFTKEQAAEAHTQVGAKALSNQVILDWLMETLHTAQKT